MKKPARPREKFRQKSTLAAKEMRREGGATPGAGFVEVEAYRRRGKLRSVCRSITDASMLEETLGERDLGPRLLVCHANLGCSFKLETQHDVANINMVVFQRPRILLLQALHLVYLYE